jgi:hypothetical protein
MRARFGSGLVVGLALGGCAMLRIDVIQNGTAPVGSAGFAMLAAADPSAPPGLADAVGRRLVALGVAVNVPRAAIKVEWSYSERAPQVGGYSTMQADGGPAWLAPPERPPWWWFSQRPLVRQLEVRLTEATTGREVYRGRAAELSRSPRQPDWDRLATEALPAAPADALKAPPGPKPPAAGSG